jgi:hypothetical protein
VLTLKGVPGVPVRVTVWVCAVRTPPRVNGKVAVVWFAEIVTALTAKFTVTGTDNTPATEEPTLSAALYGPAVKLLTAAWLIDRFKDAVEVDTPDGTRVAVSQAGIVPVNVIGIGPLATVTSNAWAAGGDVLLITALKFAAPVGLTLITTGEATTKLTGIITLAAPVAVRVRYPPYVPVPRLPVVADTVRTPVVLLREADSHVPPTGVVTVGVRTVTAKVLG